jgi:hypothetical protein
MLGSSLIKIFVSAQLESISLQETLDLSKETKGITNALSSGPRMVTSLDIQEVWELIATTSSKKEKESSLPSVINPKLAASLESFMSACQLHFYVKELEDSAQMERLICSILQLQASNRRPISLLDLKRKLRESTDSWLLIRLLRRKKKENEWCSVVNHQVITYEVDVIIKKI